MVLRIFSNSTDSLNFLGWIWLNSFKVNLNCREVHTNGGARKSRTYNLGHGVKRNQNTTMYTKLENATVLLESHKHQEKCISTTDGVKMLLLLNKPLESMYSLRYNQPLMRPATLIPHPRLPPQSPLAPFRPEKTSGAC